MSNDVLPATVKWPDAGELTLALDPAGQAKVTFLGAPGPLTGQKHHANGTLEIDMNSEFSPTFIDISACQRAIPGSGATYFELYFLDDQVHGVTVDVVTCQLSNDIVSVGYRFDLVGDRVEQ